MTAFAQGTPQYEVSITPARAISDFELPDDATEFQIRERIARLEAVIAEMPQMDFRLKHTFTTGVYVREIFLPKGAVLVGKIHRHDHANFISYGDVTVLTKDGRQRLKGPCTLVSTAGTKRAVYVHEDTVWTTIHANPTNETDLAKIEDFVICKDYEELPYEAREVLK